MKSIYKLQLAFSVSLLLLPVGYAVEPLNTVNDGRIIQGGTYYNTPNGKTTFINSGSGGLWLKAGTTVRGLEAKANGALTNNGGTVQLYAPGNVVRVDGNINVNSVLNGSGVALGNGGKVFIDSAYLFQNGNIFANGLNGGLVQVNVAGMTLGVGAQIQANGVGGAGGVVAVNSSGPVDLRRGSLIDTSGRVIGSFDTNLINIEGSLVNIDGNLRANGVSSGSRGGTIRLVANGQTDVQELKEDLQSATTGSDPTLTSQERIFLLQRLGSLQDGSIILSKDMQNTTPQYIANLSANGTAGNVDSNNDRTQHLNSRSGDGGTILLNAVNLVRNQGMISANGAAGTSQSIHGGDGGTISVVSMNAIENLQGRFNANGGSGNSNTNTGGNGGNGGLQAFHYRSMQNTGGIYADGGIGGSAPNPGQGGNGGLVMLSGDSVFSFSQNPTGNGSIDAIGRPGGNGNLLLGGKSGTIISTDPQTLGRTQSYFQQGYVNGQLIRNSATLQAQPVELLTHHENLIMLTRDVYRTYVLDNVFQRLSNATIRSVEDPTGSLGLARSEVINKNTGSSSYVYRNLVLGSNRRYQALTLDHPYWNPHVPGGAPEIVLPSPLSKDQAFTTLNTLTILNDGSVSTQYLPGPYSDDTSTVSDVWQIGRNSNNLGGGRISLISRSQGFTNQNLFGTVGTASGGSINIATLGTINNTGGGMLNTGTFFPFGPPTALHGGSVILKSRFGDIAHGWDVQSYDQSVTRADGALMGGTIRMNAGNDFLYGGGLSVNFISAQGDLQGGTIKIKAGHDIPPPSGMVNGLFADGLSPTQGRGGYINLHANHINSGQIPAQANGGLANGTVIVTEGD